MQVNAIGLRAPKPAKPQKLSRERSVTWCLNTLRTAVSVRANASFISNPANLADAYQRCRTVAARTQAESDRLTMGCGGVLNGCGQGITEKNSRLAPRAGFEPATIRLTVECSTAELPRNRRNPMGSRRAAYNKAPEPCKAGNRLLARNLNGRCKLPVRQGLVTVFDDTKNAIWRAAGQSRTTAALGTEPQKGVFAAHM